MAPRATCRSCSGERRSVGHDRRTYRVGHGSRPCSRGQHRGTPPTRSASRPRRRETASIRSTPPDHRARWSRTRDHRFTSSDTDPAELAVDADRHRPAQPATAPTARRCPAARARARRASPPRSTASWPRRWRCSARPARAGEVTKLATLGTVTAPAGRRGRARRRSRPAPRRPPETLRRAAGAAVRALAGAPTVALALPLPDDADDAGRALRAVAEGALLGAYRFAGYKTKPQPARRDPVEPVSVHVPDAADDGAPRPRSTRAAVVAARGRPHPGLGQHRPQRAAPAGLRRRRSPRPPREAGLDVEVLDEKALRKGGYGGILAVGMGSEAPPRLVAHLHARRARRPQRWRWSARASPSTPAASRSSRRRACGR